MRFRKLLLFSLLLSTAACRTGAPPAAAPMADGAEMVMAALENPEFNWLSRTTQHFRVHAPLGSYASRAMDAIIAEAESAREEVLGRLQVPAPDEPAELFLVDNRERMRMLVGQPAKGWAAAGDNALFFVVTATESPPLRHEMGHLFSWRGWGEPAGHWLSEGVGMFAVGGCAGHDLHAWAAALEADDELPSPRDLARDFDFGRDAPHLAAGSFVQFVVEEHGLDALRALWTGGLAASGAATGHDAEALETAWRARIADPRYAQRPTAPMDETGRIVCE